MADFNQYFPKLLELEGGLVNHPNDPGGLTNMGITLSTFQHVAPSILGIPGTAENLINLTTDQAYKIYKKHFWDRINADKIPSQKVAEIIVDGIINHPSTIGLIVQHILNTRFSKQLALDNVIGPLTQGALHSVSGNFLYKHILEARRQYYHYRAGVLSEVTPEWLSVFQMSGVQPNLTQSVFLQGWLNRLKNFPAPAAITAGTVFFCLASILL